MVHKNVVRKSRMGKLLLGAVALLIAAAFLQPGLRRSAASNAQKGGSAAGAGQKGGSSPRVTIDVNPGGAKVIDLGSRADLDVAILGTSEFNVGAIDASSLNFAGASVTKTADSVRPRSGGSDKATGLDGAIKFNVGVRDVNKDGISDFVATFPIAFLTQLSEGTPTAVLRGKLFDGSPFEGSQTVEAAGVSPIKGGGGANAPGGGPPQFCNPVPIVFPADPPGSGNAAPFPSNILVAGGPASISGVVVTLNDVSHTFPDDLEIILVSPGSKVLILDNGAWDGTDAVAQDITFSQTTANYAPESAAMVTGAYKPASYFDQTFFGAPAPALTTAAPYAHTFNTFNGTNANGTWSLYARDVVSGDTGTIAGGWCISFPTNSPACTNQLFTGSIAAGDTTQTGRVVRDGISALCGTTVSDPCAANDAITKRYDSYSITNNSGVSTCVTATLTTGCGTNIFLAVYSGSYNPASVCTNYIASIGGSPSDESPTMSFTLTAGTTAVLVVHEIAATGCASYGLLVEGNVCAPVGGCTLTCPGNVTQGNDPNQCGAVVTYPAPTTTGTCGTVTCSPASGSFFPKGTTTVTCSANGGAGPFCTFTVTVNDTQPPSITCPANITRSNDPNQCGAVVTYPPPTVSDNCPGVGAPQCSPASGSFFPVGTTTVTCTVADSSGNTATCTFTITVNDTQPPSITCPANQTAVTNQNVCPSPACQIVNFPPPVASDNCPGVTVVCNPPAGSCFPIGITTVTCTATDASGNTATCSFTVTIFDVALQDDSDPSIIMLWNSLTGQYRFCCKGVTFTGVGKSRVQGCTYTLDHSTAPDRRVFGKVDKAAHAGNASLQFPAGTTRCTITDRNTLDDTLLPACQ